MSNMARDRLDGTKRRSLFVEFYLLPGRIILWFNFMFPSRGYKNVRQTARHARSPFMTFFYSTLIWVFLLYLVFPKEFLGAVDRINNLTSETASIGTSVAVDSNYTKKPNEIDSSKNSSTSIEESRPTEIADEQSNSTVDAQTPRATSVQDSNTADQLILSELKVGMRPREVKKILGEPVSVERNKRTEIWNYIISDQPITLNFYKKAFVHRLVSWEG